MSPNSGGKKPGKSGASDARGLAAAPADDRLLTVVEKDLAIKKEEIDLRRENLNHQKKFDAGIDGIEVKKAHGKSDRRGKRIQQAKSVFLRHRHRRGVFHHGAGFQWPGAIGGEIAHNRRQRGTGRIRRLRLCDAKIRARQRPL
ncbi:MAG: hypothetical protein OD817_08245 [Gammaproteobacteria bacterium]